MSRQSCVRWIAVVAVVAGLAAVAASAGAAHRERSALDEGEREHGRPEIETVVLRFAHIPAESFVETLQQLAEHPEIRKGLDQMPLAVNEPANAVVLIAPPEVADAMRHMAEELDQPNEFFMHERERDAEELAWQVEMEERKRDFDRDQAEFELEMKSRYLDLKSEWAQRHRGPEPAGPRDVPLRQHAEAERRRHEMEHAERRRHEMEEAERHRHEMEEAERRRHEMEGAERHRREHLERIEAEQRELEEMFNQHRREAEQHLKELDRKRDEIQEAHRRRIEEFGDRLSPDQREAHERALHEHMKNLERAREEARRKIEEAHRQLEERLRDLERKKHEMMEGPHPEKPGREEPRRREPVRPAPRLRRAVPEGEAARPQLGPELVPFGGLLSPRGREAIGLSDEQVEQIRHLAERLRRHMQETMEGVREKMRRVGPEERERILRELKEKMAGRWGDQRRAVMERLGDILTADQRERLKDWMRERRGPAPERRDPRPERPQRGRPRGSRGDAGPAGRAYPADCRLL